MIALAHALQPQALRAFLSDAILSGDTELLATVAGELAALREVAGGAVARRRFMHARLAVCHTATAVLHERAGFSERDVLLYLECAEARLASLSL